jgi:hypothetical protein
MLGISLICLLLLDVIILISSGEEHRLRRSSLHSFLTPPSLHPSPVQIFFSAHCSEIPLLPYYTLKDTDQVSHPYTPTGKITVFIF